MSEPLQNEPGRRSRFDSIPWLALCPLLAISDTVVNALGMSTAILIVVPLTTLAMMAIRRWLAEETLLPASILLLAGIVACVELLMTAWFHDLRQSLGVFVPLMVANIVIVSLLMTGQLHSPDEAGGNALWDSVKLSLGMALTLFALSLARELVGRGSLLHGAGMLGSWAASWEMKVFRVDMGFLLAMLPPGAFISLGLMLAARNWLRHRES